MDARPVHKFLSAISKRRTRENRRYRGICYDGIVRKQQAIRQGRAFLKHIVPAFIKPAHTLWNEVIGFIFLCLSVIFGAKAVKSGINHDMFRMFLAGFCTALTGWYGISSFLRARKISRS